MEYNMNKDEKSLLLFLETIAVDQRGWVNSIECLNLEDTKIMKQWNKSGFVISKKASRQYREKTQLTYIIKLSNEAWKEVHKLRREKAERNIPEELKILITMNYRISFGKYKGKTIKEIYNEDKGYLGWLEHETENFDWSKFEKLKEIRKIYEDQLRDRVWEDLDYNDCWCDSC